MIRTIQQSGQEEFASASQGPSRLKPVSGLTRRVPRGWGRYPIDYCSAAHGGGRLILAYKNPMKIGET